LAVEGATPAASPREVAEKSEVVITIVTDTPDVQQVLLGKNGVVEGLQTDTVVIDMSTISPTATREMADTIQQKGTYMLDAPVSGGEGGAIAGTLSIMVGGNEAIFNRCLPIFEAMGKNIVHLGETGSGQLTKLCNQIAVAVTNLAMSEALIFGAKAGINLKKMQQAISGGAAGSWQLANLAPRILKRDFAPGFMVELQQKDLRLVLQEADHLKLALPATSLVHHLFNALETRGAGGEGTQALVKVLEQLAGVTVK
jgi:3-hydroxyisobutyrate dehydrogenase